MAVSCREGLSGELLLQNPEWVGEKEQGVPLYVCVSGVGVDEMVVKIS